MTKKNLQNNREQIIFFIYRQQLLHHDLKSIKIELLENNQNFSSDVINNIILLFRNKKIFITTLNQYLKLGWHFSKLSNLEQAILLWSSYEMIILKIIPAIIINEAVLITKKYFINTEYKYINGVLQKISDDLSIISKKINGAEDNGK